MNKKNKKAAALRYRQQIDNAPKLVAKGQGSVADEIIKKAKEYGIHIKEDADLIEVLYSLDINEEIPASLYEVVAKLLAELYKINNLKD
ncbi:MAG: EscU/YscU/HrcU family type III secretion system export apparatus switch protein [Deferribacterota bacterium]|nr:EscU/YscU/HrcU family type III secretion system export apparatus switch protein [Deferribacterota bacterium]